MSCSTRLYPITIFQVLSSSLWILKARYFPQIWELIHYDLSWSRMDKVELKWPHVSVSTTVTYWYSVIFARQKPCLVAVTTTALLNWHCRVSSLKNLQRRKRQIDRLFRFLLYGCFSDCLHPTCTHYEHKTFSRNIVHKRVQVLKSSLLYRL